MDLSNGEADLDMIKPCERAAVPTARLTGFMHIMHISFTNLSSGSLLNQTFDRVLL